MAIKFKEIKDYTGGFKDRSHWERQAESRWAHKAIGNIEDFLTDVKWDDLGGSPTFSKKEKKDVYSQLKNLKGWNKDRLKEIKGINTRSDANKEALSLLTKRLDNWDTTTEVGDVVGLDDVLGNLKKDYQSDIKGIETQLGDYLKTGDFNTRMTTNLDALEKTLRGEFGDQIGALDIEGVREAIESQGGDLTKLTTDFSGLSKDVGTLEDTLRTEFGDDLLGLSDTFDTRLGDVQSALGGDISKLFKESDTLQSGIDTLTSGLGTTTEQLEALSDSFGDYKTDSATNLANVEAAFAKQIGDQGTDFTKQLGDLESSTAQDILNLKGDVTAERVQALSDLDTTWSGKLQAQDDRLKTQFDEGTEALNKRLSDITASMNYKTLDDSAQGVKIRRSRAYNQGRTRSGTGQLGRSMKISTLNI